MTTFSTKEAAMIPSHLLSSCLDRMGFGMSACPGGCGDDVRRNQMTGRWFITMGHCGFNCDRNNGEGFASKGQARRVSIQFSGKGPGRKLPR
jgi:hypothetical protein